MTLHPEFAGRVALLVRTPSSLVIALLILSYQKRSFLYHGNRSNHFWMDVNK
jgi:hypothetical protein